MIFGYGRSRYGCCGIILDMENFLWIWIWLKRIEILLEIMFLYKFLGLGWIVMLVGFLLI